MFFIGDTLPLSLTRGKKQVYSAFVIDYWDPHTKKMNVTEFWLVRKEYHLISVKTLKFLFVVSTTFLCECALSLLLCLKKQIEG